MKFCRYILCVFFLVSLTSTVIYAEEGAEALRNLLSGSFDVESQHYTVSKLKSRNSRKLFRLLQFAKSASKSDKPSLPSNFRDDFDAVSQSIEIDPYGSVVEKLNVSFTPDTFVIKKKSKLTKHSKTRTSNSEHKFRIINESSKSISFSSKIKDVDTNVHKSTLTYTEISDNILYYTFRVGTNVLLEAIYIYTKQGSRCLLVTYTVLKGGASFPDELVVARKTRNDKK